MIRPDAGGGRVNRLAAWGLTGHLNGLIKLDRVPPRYARQRADRRSRARLDARHSRVVGRDPEILGPGYRLVAVRRVESDHLLLLRGHGQPAVESRLVVLL